MYTAHLSHLTIEGHVSCFHLLVTVDNAAMKWAHSSLNYAFIL